MNKTMNHDSAEGVQRPDKQALIDDGQPGDWFIDAEARYIYIHIPDFGITAWPIGDESLPNGSCWTWDGNREAPTLTPSLHLVGFWHGWMRNGKLISA